MPRKTYAIILILLTTMGLTLAAGCASSPDTGDLLSQTPALSPEALAPAEPVQRGLEGSLFAQAQPVNLYRDLKAYQLGDIVTINIVETSQASKQAQTDASRSSSLTAGISALLGYENSLPHKPGATFTPGTAIKGSLGSDFTGSGQTSRKESMTAQMSARVAKVLPNGDLVIRGAKEIMVNHEKQYMLLQGVIRPTDIASDNTILSSYIADARIEYIGEGVVTDKQKPGWLTRFMEKIWPF